MVPTTPSSRRRLQHAGRSRRCHRWCGHARACSRRRCREAIGQTLGTASFPVTTAGIGPCWRGCPGSARSSGSASRAPFPSALRCLDRRHQHLTVEIGELDDAMHELCVAENAALLGACGVGAEVAAALLIAAGDNPERMRSEASFAALCGASPVQASSGKTVRHRLNQGGNRDANNALWRIVPPPNSTPGRPGYPASNAASTTTTNSPAATKPG